jgi:hypothetical protein
MDTDERTNPRPKPGPGDTERDADATERDTDNAPAREDGEAQQREDGEARSQSTDIPQPKEGGDGKIALDRSDESQDFVDQSKIDFDPDDGLYSGTAVDGTTEIPGPHAGDGDEQSVIDQAKEMAGDDPPASEATVGVLTRGQQKRERDDAEDPAAKDDRAPDSSDEQAYK